MIGELLVHQILHQWPSAPLMHWTRGEVGIQSPFALILSLTIITFWSHYVTFWSTAKRAHTLAVQAFAQSQGSSNFAEQSWNASIARFTAVLSLVNTFSHIFLRCTQVPGKLSLETRFWKVMWVIFYGAIWWLYLKSLRTPKKAFLKGCRCHSHLHQ